MHAGACHGALMWGRCVCVHMHGHACGACMWGASRDNLHIPWLPGAARPRKLVFLQQKSWSTRAGRVIAALAACGTWVTAARLATSVDVPSGQARRHVRVLHAHATQLRRSESGPAMWRFKTLFAFQRPGYRAALTLHCIQSVFLTLAAPCKQSPSGAGVAVAEDGRSDSPIWPDLLGLKDGRCEWRRGPLPAEER